MVDSKVDLEACSKDGEVVSLEKEKIMKEPPKFNMPEIGPLAMYLAEGKGVPPQVDGNIYSLVVLSPCSHPSLSNVSSLALSFPMLGLYWELVYRGLGSIVSSSISKVSSAQVPCPIPPPPFPLSYLINSISLVQSEQ